MSKMNEAQKVVARVYGDGDYQHLIEIDDADVAEGEGHGDTLLTFLMRELADDGSEGMPVHEARRRVAKARDDLEDVLRAFPMPEESW